ncbi:MAG: type I-E CRISPR-associated protein Cse1/CasA, partial [Deltaproteobacteria bacterium]
MKNIVKPPENYNLLDEEWIPVLYRDGRMERVGIRKALKDAHLIRQIAASNPMDRVAILRFLLALLYWCKENLPDDANAISGDSFFSGCLKKLEKEKNRDCFNL